jgi:hypothetical protein
LCEVRVNALRTNGEYRGENRDGLRRGDLAMGERENERTGDKDCGEMGYQGGNCGGERLTDNAAGVEYSDLGVARRRPEKGVGITQSANGFTDSDLRMGPYRIG